MVKEFEPMEKEEVATLVFPHEDVLDDKLAISQRKQDLERASALGNTDHVKIKIYFKDDVANRVVETTIWGVTDQRIILKKGVLIPIHRIYKID